MAGDMLVFFVCAGLLGAYHIYLRIRLRRNPSFTIQAVNFKARAQWVEGVMGDRTKDVLAIQTLRNSTMAATLMASTAVLLIIGVLTLSGQGEKLSGTWHVLNFFGDTRAELWVIKLLALMADFFVAFFSFSMSVRLFNHVGYMINTPISPRHVAMYLNKAGSYYSVGMRAYYFSVPLVFWLFGPLLMLASTVALIVILYNIDRAPSFLSEDFKDSNGA
ncbi:MAG: DUF599 domain-containing protein [Nitrospinae bacterium]|nr:DUF599 domain-containing protein [Nitrospinota bacterium]